MSTITSVEQRLPISIQLLSRISTYAHVFESVLAIILFGLFPSLSPKMPERQIFFRPRYFEDSASIHSIASSVSTLIDEDLTDNEDDEDTEISVDEDEIKFRKLSILSAPMAKSKSLSLMPFARRMSLPAKRFSEHFTTTLSNPFQTSSPSPLQTPIFDTFDSPHNSPILTSSSEFEPTSCLTPPTRCLDHVHFVDSKEVEKTVVEVKQLEEIEYFEKELSREPMIIITKEKVVKVTKIRRVAKKAKSFLRIRRQS
ncbi:hypothetical protein BDZ94DRAFT_381955 [Collybia nuda]|uniref:Uncharacterized protein n=1 Tax=Collybia nuda TaxID=64659 RepID=A0A9P5YIB1_9AGAR|nr:hypothetical protein BDZ94DRAFT_381955 [Collybia nuda]